MLPPLEGTFRRLFEFLENEGYVWRALSPERVKKIKESGDANLDPLTLFFGVGEGEWPAGLSELDGDSALRGLRPAVSRIGGRLVAHDHWDAAGEIAYLSAESYELWERLPDCTGLRVLDLGSGAGGLSLAISARAREVVGIELSGRAVEWARASAAAQGILNVRFEAGRIPHFSPGGKFDLAVFNPPMGIPEATPRPHRDGGALGCETPIAFLNFAHDQLRPGGEACFLATSPVIRGQSVLRDQVMRDPLWQEVRSERLHSHFNQSLARKAGYAALGIERVELWFFRLQRG